MLADVDTENVLSDFNKQNVLADFKADIQDVENAEDVQASAHITC